MTPEQALHLARFAHYGQLDKAGQSYVNHLRRVADRVQTDDAKVVALLHDIMEDTRVDNMELLHALGVPSNLVKDIWLLTRYEFQDYLASYILNIVNNGSPIAKEVKCADLNDHLERLERKDCPECESLKPRYLAAHEMLNCPKEER